MKHILLVEDDENLAMGVQYSLEMEDMKVTRAGSIKSAKETFVSDKFDLILLDLMLPDGSGYDFCKFVRGRNNTPVIFLTSCDDEVNIVLGLDLGGDDYITKPFRIRELVSRIKAVIRRNMANAQNAQSMNAVIMSGDITLNLLKGKVMKKGEDIQLTPVEHKLLVMLMQNKGQILTRTQILERLWDVTGEFVDDNTLSVYVKRVRAKIEDTPSKPKYIITARGVGYKWEAE